MEAPETRVAQGYLESSNVNAVHGLHHLIVTSRSYEAFQRVIKTFADTDRRAARGARAAARLAQRLTPDAPTFQRVVGARFTSGCGRCLRSRTPFGGSFAPRSRQLRTGRCSVCRIGETRRRFSVSVQELARALAPRCAAR